jgi:hypothetical protein
MNNGSPCYWFYPYSQAHSSHSSLYYFIPLTQGQENYQTAYYSQEHLLTISQPNPPPPSALLFESPPLNHPNTILHAPYPNI